MNRLLGALAEDDIYSRTLFHRWGDFSERLFLEYAVGRRRGGGVPAKAPPASRIFRGVEHF